MVDVQSGCTQEVIAVRADFGKSKIDPTMVRCVETQTFVLISKLLNNIGCTKMSIGD